MDYYEEQYREEVKKLQADAMVKLQEDLAKAAARAKADPVKSERRAFGFELARARYEKRLSQTQLAARAGVRQADISYIEDGKGNPGLNKLLKITKALNANLMLE